MEIPNKKILAAIALALFFAVGIPAGNALAQYDNANITYNDFYQDLAPFGQWIEDGAYGYVFLPEVDANFRPYYTNGHWAMTDYGNTWLSDYPWGWACFHYGRWTYDPYYGWLWIPGTDWGPAWVSWRYGETMYGWAPLGPDYDFKGDYACPNDWWIFLPPKYIYSGNYYRFWDGPRNNKHLLHNSTFVNNVYENKNIHYVSGPHVKQVEDLTHQPVQVYKINNSKNNLRTHVVKDVIQMYRPAEIRPAPPVEGHRIPPPNVVAAPQPVNKPQPVSGRPANAPTDFRLDVPKPKAPDAVGTHFVEPEKAPKTESNKTNPYEWDVNRPVAQPEPRHQEPVQQPTQQPARTPQQQNQPQPVRAPQQNQPQPVRGTPLAPNNTRPQPAPTPQNARPQQAPRGEQPRQAPPPAQQKEEGRR